MPNNKQSEIAYTGDVTTNGLKKDPKDTARAKSKEEE